MTGPGQTKGWAVEGEKQRTVPQLPIASVEKITRKTRRGQ
jgi:hypothetical protein